MPLAPSATGETFLARLEGMRGFEKHCLIKKVLPHLKEEEDFVNEAKAWVSLQHGSIAQVLDAGFHQGELYLALEYVDGKDLRRIAARARERNMPLPLTFVLYTMSRVLDALAYAHRKRDEQDKEIGLVHREVSPQNILVSYEGEVKVIDFGLSKSTLNSSRSNLSKLPYLSPEQARNTKVDRRTDLYSVGLCLYELVAGKSPFDEVPPDELLAKVSHPTIANIQQVETLCPGPVAQTVMKALAVDPAHRYQTAEAFRGRLMSLLLEIDPSAGPESCSRFMREAFSADYRNERKMLASLKEHRVAPPPASAPRPAALGVKMETATVVTSLPETARRMLEAPLGEEVKLSFAPTPRLKEDDVRPEQIERETIPSFSLPLITPPAVEQSAAMPLESVTVPLPSSPWNANETTRPAGFPANPPRADSPAALPAVMTSEPSETFEPGQSPPAADSRRITLPIRPITAPLPQALKNRALPTDRVESTGKTASSRNGLIWVVIPLLAVLGVAGFVLYDLYRNQVEKVVEEIEAPGPLGPSNVDDRRSRELPPPSETVPPPLPEGTPPPALGAEGEVAPLGNPGPEKLPSKRKPR